MLINALRGGLNLTQAVIGILSSLVVIFLTLPVHEFAHGFVADKLGDPTPRYQGRLTLNPLHHIDYIGALAILLFGFGWAKPVGVNMRNFRNPKRDMAITALAGPLSNIIVAFIAIFIEMLVYKFTALTKVIMYVILFFEYIAQINVYLAVFNLIPVPPLDGSRLLNAFLPDRIYYRIMQYERYIIWGMFLLVYMGVFDRPLNIASNGIIEFINSVVIKILKLG